MSDLGITQEQIEAELKGLRDYLGTPPSGWWTQPGRRRQYDIGMNAVPPTWRIYRLPSTALYLLIAAAFAVGLLVGTLTA